MKGVQEMVIEKIRNKARQLRHVAAVARAEERAKRSPEEQLELLASRPGASAKETRRLQALISTQSKPSPPSKRKSKGKN